MTESETKVLLEDGLTVGGKPLRDARVLITGSQFPVAAPEKVQEEMLRLFQVPFPREVQAGFDRG